MSAWRQLPAPNRRWLVVNALFVTALINVVINTAIDLGSVKSGEDVSMWGAPLVEPSIFWTLLGTLFLLPLFTCVLATTAIRRDISRGALERAPRPEGVNPRLAEPGRWRRGVAFGLLCVLALGPGLVAILAVLDPELSRTQFVFWQTAFAVLLGMLVTPPIAVLAMSDSPAEAG